MDAYDNFLMSLRALASVTYNSAEKLGDRELWNEMVKQAKRCQETPDFAEKNANRNQMPDTLFLMHLLVAWDRYQAHEKREHFTADQKRFCDRMKTLESGVREKGQNLSDVTTKKTFWPEANWMKAVLEVLSAQEVWAAESKTSLESAGPKTEPAA